MNLEQIKHIWYATLLVPVDVREALRRKRFRKTLKTSNKREAILLAAPLIGHWKALIEQARGSSSAVSNEALRWKAALLSAPDEDTRETWELALSDEAERKEAAQGFELAKEFHDLATGRTTPTSQYFDQWKNSINLAPKTTHQMTADVSRLVAKFPTLEGITKNSVRRWIDEIEAECRRAFKSDQLCALNFDQGR